MHWLSAFPFAFLSPPWLALLPLALVPLLRRQPETVSFSSMTLVPHDPLSAVVGWLLRIAAASAIVAIVLGIAGIHRPEVPIERVGRGAEIVLLLDRSRSMDDALLPKGAQPTLYTGGTGFESKGQLARKLLSEFAAKRPDDLVSMVMFSASPIPVLPFTQKQDMIQAAITAGGISKGLSETDMGRGLLAAIANFDQRPYTGSRLVLLVSDGGAQLEPDVRERIAALYKRNRVALSFIYIRSSGSRGLEADAGDTSEAAENAPERSLHHFFQSIGIPYHAYEAENPEAMRSAIEDVGRMQNLPIQYTEMLPRRDLSPPCYAFAAAGAVVLLGAGALRVKRWP